MSLENMDRLFGVVDELIKFVDEPRAVEKRNMTTRQTTSGSERVYPLVLAELGKSEFEDSGEKQDWLAGRATSAAQLVCRRFVRTKKIDI